MSFFQRISTDASNACADMYSNWILGDDAGKSVRLTLTIRPRTNNITNKQQQLQLPLLDLGMTFIEINGRAYVKSVTPGSAAEEAGVLPQDAVHYATLYRKEWENANYKRIKGRTLHNRRNNDDGDFQMDDLFRDTKVSPEQADARAINCALDLEAKGLRISYNELRRMMADALDPMQSAFLSPATTVNNSKKATAAKSTWSVPPVPPNICDSPARRRYRHQQQQQGGALVGKNTSRNQHDAHQQQQYSDDDPYRPSSPFSQEAPRPVVFVLRRTRQRKSMYPHSNSLLPNYRLDDECDFATSLVQRLAPTAAGDMGGGATSTNHRHNATTDTWEELVHDGTDWLLGRTSMLPPPMSAGTKQHRQQQQQQRHQLHHGEAPLDDFEKERARKLAGLRSRMAAEHLTNEASDDIEAETIRGMIQKAVGLAFVRASKIVLGVSIHGGSGIVIARLSDGTWSAPSAIGTWGLGFGLQFGLEVAEYIFILQTEVAMEHFRRGGNFTIGGTIGLAAAGMGREAYGAASVGGVCGSTSSVKDDEYNDNDSREENQAPHSIAIAPIVAYAKSQGLYIGVSLEGSRIFSRDDVNSRTYKFDIGRDVSAYDILSGKVPTPAEAEELYAALHAVEFTHEMSCLPRPPEILRRDLANAWHFDRCTLVGGSSPSHLSSNNNSRDPFSFLSSLTKEEVHEIEAFETQFKNFQYGGVSVQRLLPEREGRTGRTAKERRTLWLMLPEVGSLRLGFVSKLSDGEGAIMMISNKSSTQRAREDDPSRISGLDGNDYATVGSEEQTQDSAINTRVRKCCCRCFWCTTPVCVFLVPSPLTHSFRVLVPAP
jgi:lipid-binding SYLF domain-containing protein